MFYQIKYYVDNEKLSLEEKAIYDAAKKDAKKDISLPNWLQSGHMILYPIRLSS